MAASRTGTRLGEQYRRTARRRGKQKGIIAVSRVICEIACILIADRSARFTDPGADYYSPGNPQRHNRSRIREIERLNPGMNVTLTHRYSRRPGITLAARPPRVADCCPPRGGCFRSGAVPPARVRPPDHRT
jgi:hypothetical protein